MPDRRSGQAQGHDQRDRQRPACASQRQAGARCDRYERGHAHRMAAGGAVCGVRGAVLRAKLDDGERHAAHRTGAARSHQREDQQAAAQVFRQGQLRRCAQPHHQRCGRHRPDARPVGRLADHVGHAVRGRAHHDVLQQCDYDGVRHRFQSGWPAHHGRNHEGFAEVLLPSADRIGRCQRSRRRDVRRPHRGQGVLRRG